MKKPVKVKLFRPKKFKIHNHDWKIKYVKDLFKTHNAYGLTIFDQSLILIQLPTKEFVVTEAVILNVLLHEFSHSVLRAMGREDLNQDEDFVDGFALIASQILSTLK